MLWGETGFEVEGNTRALLQAERLVECVEVELWQGESEALARENDALEVMQNLDMVAHGSRGATLQADETLYLRGDTARSPFTLRAQGGLHG